MRALCAHGRREDPPPVLKALCLSYRLSNKMKARLFFAFLSSVLAVGTVILIEYLVPTETRTNTNRFIYGAISPMVAFCMSRGIYINPFKTENFSGLFRFSLIAFVTMFLACIGIFIGLTFVQPMGFVLGVLLIVGVFMGQFFFVGPVLLILLSVFSILIFNFREKT